jgi:hypothetical protein
VEAWTVEISTNLDLSASNLLSGTTTIDVPPEEAMHGVRQPLWTVCGSMWSGLVSLIMGLVF